MCADSSYICTLEPKYVKKAKDELFEIPEDRLAAIQAFRDWIKQQEHIRLPTSTNQTDTRIILMFLRWAKFSQLRARERIQAYLKIKNISPVMWRNIDTRENRLEEIIKMGYITVLPKRDPNGSAILIYQFAAFKEKATQIEFFRAGTVTLMHALRNEMTQVNGVVTILDFSGVNAKLFAKMSDSKDKPMTKAWLSGGIDIRKSVKPDMPIRWKASFVYNAGLVIDAFLVFGKLLLTGKMFERIQVHSTMESIYRQIPTECLPIEYLPDDYTGPSAGYLTDIRKNFIKEIREEGFRKYLLYITGDDFALDESMKPEEAVTQHFRRLTIS